MNHLNPIALKPGEFLLDVPSLKLLKACASYPRAALEALSFTRAGRVAVVWSHKGRLLFPDDSCR